MVKIIIIDDHKIFRDGLIKGLKGFKEFEIIAETGSGLEAIELTKKHSPDAILMDIFLNDSNGIEIVKKIKRFSDTKVIIISQAIDAYLITQAIKAGINGFVSKYNDIKEVHRAIKFVQDGVIYLSSDVEEIYLRIKIQQALEKEKYNSLTVEEKNVFNKLISGHHPTWIASELSIPENAFELIVDGIRSKTGTDNPLELFQLAERIGLSKENIGNNEEIKT